MIGQWAKKGLVRVWVPNDEPERDTRTWLADLIACPTCHAKVTETCRTRSGHTTTPHGSRLAPRLCLCGSLLAPQRRLCDPCRKSAIQASKNEHLRRIRAGNRYAEEVA